MYSSLRGIVLISFLQNISFLFCQFVDNQLSNPKIKQSSGTFAQCFLIEDVSVFSFNDLKSTDK